MNREHKYKDNNKDKDKAADRITETLLVCYIFGILMTQAFQEWWWIPPTGQPPQPPQPSQPPQPPQPLARSKSHLTQKKIPLEMIWNGKKICHIIFLTLWPLPLLKSLAKNYFLPGMVWNGKKLVKSLFVKDQGSISRTILEQFVLFFLVVQSEMSTVVR